VKKKEVLEDLCEIVMRAIETSTDKIQKAGGGISAGDADYLKKLTSIGKNIKTILAMMDSEEESGYSGRYMYPTYSGISDATHMGPGTGSYASRSYASDYSGRRDSMGRYAREGGYSYHGDVQSIVEELRGMMGEMPDEKRREVQRFVDKMERM